MKFKEIGLSVLFVSVLSACGGGGGDEPREPVDAQEANGDTTMDAGAMDAGADQAGYVLPVGVESCSVDDIKARVDYDMRDYYIYYDQVPQLNLGDYDSGDALIQALRVDPDIYSRVRDAVSQDALSEQGRTKSFGFRFVPALDGVVRFQWIRIGSPAFDAGILRGDELITLNGRPISEVSGDEIRAIEDPSNGAPLTMTIRTADEQPRTVTITQAEYQWTTAVSYRYTPNSDDTLPVIGYLRIDAFLVPTKGEIDTALQFLEDEGGFDELVVDLRYNRGGRTFVAQYLGSIVGGIAVEGKVLMQNLRNDKYAAANETVNFEKVDKPLNLPRVHVLTTRASASSSEIFINSLKPYIDVVVIGDATEGKPFSTIPADHCDKKINAMSILRVNSAGVSVAGGIPADCRVADTWETIQEAVRDPLLAAALNYASLGTCPTDTIAGTDPMAARRAQSGPSFDQADDLNFAIAD